MKHLSWALVLGSLFFQSNVFAVNPPELIDFDFQTAYVADGFDSNDNVQIVMEGVFPDTCYKPGPAYARVNDETRTIHVRATAYLYDGLCLRMIVPYHQVLDIGILRQGNYKIVQLDKPLGEVRVRGATVAEADDYLYAPVSQAYLQNNGTSKVVTIEGIFRNSCLALKEVKVDVQKQAIVILPISDLKEPEGQPCVKGKYPFSASVAVGDLKPGKYLLHVRSLNARAINTLVEVE